MIVHSDEYDASSSYDSGDDIRFKSYENKDLKLIHKLIHCFKYVTFDKKSAGLLEKALGETIEIDINDLNKAKEFTNIPLTPEAYLDYESKENAADPFLGLTKRTHYYFSLIQYRYLLDLKYF